MATGLHQLQYKSIVMLCEYYTTVYISFLSLLWCNTNLSATTQ